ncbi:MAG: hypothetical protein WBO57_02380 [Gammaproteobacteria bacterium]
MWRIIMVAVAGLLCGACSGGISSYEDGLKAHAEIMTQMVGVLEGVTDQASADEASGEIEALGNRLAEVAAQVQNLPRPSPEEMQEIAQKQLLQSQEFQKMAVPQMMKLAQYKSLSDAWMRALSSM